MAQTQHQQSNTLCLHLLHLPWQNTIDWGLNNTELFLTVLEPGKFKIRVPADLAPGEGSPPDLQMVISPCPLVAQKDLSDGSS